MEQHEATWIVGSGGMLGMAVRRLASGSYAPRGIPWDDPSAAISALRSQGEEFARRVGDAPWRVFWLAGAAVVAADDAAVDSELATFNGLVAVLRDVLPDNRGTFFVASSAGGVYAGSAEAPFDELSRPEPLAPYGALKLAQEKSAGDALGDRARVVLGRYSNLYGPGQNLQKAQGLISQLCLASVRRRSTNLYVPLETMRDYLYVDDAAAMTLDAVGRAEEGSASGITLRVLCSGEPATIARVVDLIHRQTKRRPLISLGVHPAARRQVRDLRLQSVHPEQRVVARTSLTVGVSNVLRQTVELVRRAHLR